MRKICLAVCVLAGLAASGRASDYDYEPAVDGRAPSRLVGVLSQPADTINADLLEFIRG